VYASCKIKTEEPAAMGNLSRTRRTEAKVALFGSRSFLCTQRESLLNIDRSTVLHSCSALKDSRPIGFTLKTKLEEYHETFNAYRSI